MTSEPIIERADLGMAWAVKDSLIGYVQGMYDGRILLGDGAAMTTTRQFYFPFIRQDRIDNCLVLQFAGEVCFIAHQGLMTVALGNPRIEVNSEAAHLYIQQGNTALRLADLHLPESQSEDGITMWPQIEATLSSTGVETFGDTYSAGELLAPLTVRVPSLKTTP